MLREVIVYPVPARVHAAVLTGDGSLESRIRRAAASEGLLEHVNVRVVDGETRITLFLGHDDAIGADAVAADLLRRAR